jgi:hypothetical protein
MKNLFKENKHHYYYCYWKKTEDIRLLSVFFELMLNKCSNIRPLRPPSLFKKMSAFFSSYWLWLSEKYELEGRWRYLAAVTGGALLLGVGAPFISTVAGTAYPLYMTYLVLQQQGEGASDLVFWLKYWALFSALVLLESLSLDLFTFHIPLYFVWKTLLLLWAQHPEHRGAEVLYEVPVLKGVALAKGS